MNLAEFVSSERAAWDELDALIETAHGRSARLGAEGVRRLGELYRAASGDLGIARRKWPNDPVVVRLERSVTNARALVYGASKPGRALVEFFRRDLWRSILERPACLVASFVLLFAPAALSGLWAFHQPQQAAQYVPSQYRSVAERGRYEHNRQAAPSASDETGLAAEIMTNNIRVTFFAFGGGLLLGIGTIFSLVQNAMLLGVLSGLAIGAGNSHPFFELILPHGVLELSCIVVSGAAGFRVAWAIIAPGHRRRASALRDEARGAVKMVIGAALWLIVAGLVEGFVTPSRVGFGPAIAIGVSLGVIFWSLVFVLGRDRDSERASNAKSTDEERQILAESFSLR